MSTAGAADPPAGTGPEGIPEPTTGPIRIIGVGRPDRPAVGWTEILAAGLGYVALQVVLGAVALGVAGGGRLPASPWLIAGSAVCAFGAIGVAWVVRVRSFAALGLRRVRARTVLLGVGLGVAVWIVSRVLVVVYVQLTGDTTDPQDDLAVFSGPVATVLVLALGGLLVPLGEEILFRGVLFGGLRRYGVVVAALVSALAFGLAHGLDVVLPAAVLLGLVNAVTYERTRSVWPCAATHATFNLLSFGLVLLLR